MGRLMPLPALSVVLLGACGSNSAESSEPGLQVLAPLTDLTPVEANRDPLAPHRPTSIECTGLTGWYTEENALEVSTAECNYLALTEPAAVSAPAGSTVTTQIYHYDLTAPEPAEAHLALLINKEVLWESIIPIPSDANVIDVSFELPQDVDEGAPLGIHLHNHGQNTWRLSPWMVSP